MIHLASGSLISPSIQQDIVQLNLISGPRMSTSGHNSPHFRFNNLDNDREEDRKPSIHQDIVQLDLISGSKMSTSGHNSPHFRFNNLDNDREEDHKPSIH